MIPADVLDCLHCEKMIECGGSLRKQREGVENCIYGGTAGRTDEHISMARNERSIDYTKFDRYYKEHS